MACGTCEFVNFPGELYCGGCGIARRGAPTLAAEISKESTERAHELVRAGPARPGPALATKDRAVHNTAERRQVTVMFCDLVGSTAMSTELDAEDLRDVIASFQASCEEAVRGFGGFIARYMGDGMLVYFGYPQAREDSAERAVRAGLAILDAVSALRVGSVRVGIATGEVVIGDLIGEGVAKERAVVGETPNLAARLQSLAEPDTLVISDTTCELTAGLFETEDLGRAVLKGFEEPVQAWRVVSASGQRARARHFGPMVGRAHECEIIEERWQAACEGDGHAMAIVGEPGMGKSHLAEAAIAAIGVEELSVRRWVCERHAADKPFQPLIRWLEGRAGIELSDPAPARRQKLEAWARASLADAEARLGALFFLMGVPHEGVEPPGPDVFRSESKALLSAELEQALARGPCVVVVEDLQWADPLTLDLARVVAESASGNSLLVLMTFRPDFDPGWPSANLIPLKLSRLPPECSRELVERGIRGAGEEKLPVATIEAIIRRAEGIPSFVTELTRAVIRTGGEGAAVPESLRDSLASQIDAVDAQARSVAQLAATIGRDFSEDILSRAYDGSGDQLQRGLDLLAEAGLVLAPRIGYGERWSFRHALLRDLAYQRLLRRDRKVLHCRIADVLIDELPAAGQADPAALAWHLQQAERFTEAAPHWTRAGDQTAARGVPREAVAHYERAVRAYEKNTQPADDDLRRACVDLRTLIASNQRLFGAIEEAYASLEAAEPVALELQDHLRLSRIYFQRGNLDFRRGKIDECMDSHQQALAQARLDGSAEAQANAYGGLADAHLVAYEIPVGLEYYRRCIAIAEEQGFARMAAANSAPLSFSTLWMLKTDEAWAVGLEAVRRSEAVGDHRSRGNAYYLMSAICWMRGDYAGLRTWLDRLREVATVESEILVGSVAVYGARLAIHEGRLDDARESLAQMLDQISEARVVAQGGATWLELGAFHGPGLRGDAAYETRRTSLVEVLVKACSRERVSFIGGMFALQGLIGLMTSGDVVSVGRILDVAPRPENPGQCPQLILILDSAQAWLAAVRAPRSEEAAARMQAMCARAREVQHLRIAEAMEQGLALVEKVGPYPAFAKP